MMTMQCSQEEAALNGRNLAEAFNCTRAEVEEVESCLRKVDASDLSRCVLHAFRVG